MKGELLFTMFHAAEVFLNNVTSPYGDFYVSAPENTVTAVQRAKI